MKNNMTELVFILDRSGSMAGLEEDTIGGCTALMDAIGGAIRHIRNIHRYARPEDVPENTIFVITTDGMENASRFYSAGSVREMVEAQKKAGHGVD